VCHVLPRFASAIVRSFGFVKLTWLSVLTAFSPTLLPVLARLVVKNLTAFFTESLMVKLCEEPAGAAHTRPNPAQQAAFCQLDDDENHRGYQLAFPAGPSEKPAGLREALVPTSVLYDHGFYPKPVSRQFTVYPIRQCEIGRAVSDEQIGVLVHVLD